MGLKTIDLGDPVLSFQIKSEQTLLRGQTHRDTSSWRPRPRTQLSHVQQGLSCRLPKGCPYLEGIHFQDKSGKNIVMIPFLACFHF